MYVSESGAGVAHSLPLEPGRCLYVVCIEGEAGVKATCLARPPARPPIHSRISAPFFGY